MANVVASTIDQEHVVLRDGPTVVIRPLTTGDETTIDNWFAGLGRRPATSVS